MCLSAELKFLRQFACRCFKRRGQAEACRGSDRSADGSLNLSTKGLGVCIPKYTPKKHFENSKRTVHFTRMRYSIILVVYKKRNSGRRSFERTIDLVIFCKLVDVATIYSTALSNTFL